MDKIEILTRLSSSKQILSPFAFLPEVKKQGHTAALDIGVLKKSLEYISMVQNPDMIYSINLYKSTLCGECTHQSIRELLEFYKIRAGRIVFEILEDDAGSGCPSQLESTSPFRIFPIQRQQAIIHNKKPLIPDKVHDRRICPCKEMPHLILNESMQRFKDIYGMLFSVDDFPSGTNCMHNVYKMQGISYVKIDGIWLRNMLENFRIEFQESEWEEIFLREFHKILLEVRRIHPYVIFIVERVEDEDLFNLFSKIEEIQYFQGYFFSKTKDINDIEGEIAEHNIKGV
ncbi:hypothetical protein AUK10_00450 [Candidatus Gracilibacteria bacterium CG2_30_37_12]|nr:MAG: hypothetical protein AUK10_00450 [Candidatus Gracilibacteria bacterium CG2_30_37_12]